MHARVAEVTGLVSQIFGQKQSWTHGGPCEIWIFPESARPNASFLQKTRFRGVGVRPGLKKTNL